MELGSELSDYVANAHLGVAQLVERIERSKSGDLYETDIDLINQSIAKLQRARAVVRGAKRSAA